MERKREEGAVKNLYLPDRLNLKDKTDLIVDSFIMSQEEDARKDDDSLLFNKGRDSSSSSSSSRLVSGSSSNNNSNDNALPQQPPRPPPPLLLDVALSTVPERCLETKESVSHFSSHSDHYQQYMATQAWWCHDWVAWLTVGLFCSSYILVPITFGALLSSALLCSRGAEVLSVVRTVLLYIVNWAYLPSSVSNLLSSVAAEADPLLVVAADQFTCPGTDTVGTSTLVCRVCDIAQPGKLAVGVLVALVVLCLTPHHPWPLFKRIFQIWFRIFNFSGTIDQSQWWTSQLKARNYGSASGGASSISSSSSSRNCGISVEGEDGDGNPLLYVIVPHGVVPLGCLMGISYGELFLPGLQQTPAAASVLFRLPVIRQIFTWLGAVPADRENLVRLLVEERRNVSILPGGIAELFLSHRRREQVYLRRRKGFVRLAIETGATIVPVYIFGHTRLFDQLATGEGWLGWLTSLSRLTRSSITLFWGQWFLPVPYKTDITVAFGKHIVVPATPAADRREREEQCDTVHAKFIAAVEDLYHIGREAAGYGGIELEIV